MALLLLVPFVGIGIAANYLLTGNLTATLPCMDYWPANLGQHLFAVTSAEALGSFISVEEELGWRGMPCPSSGSG